jgi:AcrR family transcriptional regulator
MSIAHKLTGHERKAAIVDGAIKVFSEKGFRGSTTRELASAVGVSEPVLYQHFATKRDLYAAIIDSKSHDVENVVADLASYLEADDDRAFFRHLADMILDFHESDPAYLRLLLFSALERHELSDLFAERHSCAFVQQVVHYIERRIEQGAIRPLNPVLIATSFLGMVAQHGMNRMLSTDKRFPLDREELVEGMVDIFMKGIVNEAR